MKWFLFFISINCFAEYRVYQYLIRPTAFFPQDKSEYIVTSSLDPVSYVSYNGGADSMKVELARTWICPGHTGNFKVYCKSPYQRLLKEDALQEEVQ